MPYRDGQWVNDKNSELVDLAFSQVTGESKAGWVSETGFKFKKVTLVEHKLPAGVYSFFESDNGRFFEKQNFPTDKPVSLPGLPCEHILNQIKMFWDKREVYHQHGLLHKRGILLYGSPGCGKTSIIRLLCDEIIKADGVVFSIDSFQKAATFVSEFRQAEPERPILTIQEDIEGFFDGTAGADELKAALGFLDGENQTDNIVHLATTNEPEKLADRFIKRPGRFDLVIGLHAPLRETREAYLRHVDPNLDSVVLQEIVEKTDGLSLAYLRELISTHVCLGIPIDETLSRIRTDSKKKILKNKKSEEKFGFTVGYEGDVKKENQ